MICAWALICKSDNVVMTWGEPCHGKRSLTLSQSKKEQQGMLSRTVVGSPSANQAVERRGGGTAQSLCWRLCGKGRAERGNSLGFAGFNNSNWL